LPSCADFSTSLSATWLVVEKKESLRRHLQQLGYFRHVLLTHLPEQGHTHMFDRQ
jgi:hypothetical protein